MTKTMCPETEIALFSEDGRYWFDADAPDFKRPIVWEANEHVTKIVIGTLEKDGDKPKLISTRIPDDLASLYPNLTHLHLWQIENLTHLPPLPPKLECLDVRGCEKFLQFDTQQQYLASLEYLHLDGCRQLMVACKFSSLRLLELTIQNCTSISETWLNQLLCGSAALKHLDAQGCTQLRSIPTLPPSLLDLRLNDCERLSVLATQGWPETLRRLELNGASKIATLPDFPPALDYIDLRHTKSLRALPRMPLPSLGVPQQRRPRTLFLFESGVPLERDLYGETEETNVAVRVLADIDASKGGRVADHELKVILLGNGRSGKSSLARRLVGDAFRRKETSTHGIRLWEKDCSFTPTDDPMLSTARLNIWDFAGQDLYHSTHRLFLQSHAIFIICHTEHPLGADQESDTEEYEALERNDEEIQRPLKYWIDQVESLGKIPGIDRHPPVLIVRTKLDRDGERSVVPTLDTKFNQVAFSAKTADGLPEVEDWIESQVESLMGKFPQRSLPASAMAVKQELLPLIAENYQCYRNADESNPLVKSPHPTFGREAFEQLVKKHCSGQYADAPQILLERFHRSGFFYYNPAYLPDDILLDQRWAINGIYTFSSRESRFQVREMLKDANGQFLASDLAKHSWKKAGYDEKAQRLFLAFMRSCGMCFELLSKDETVERESVFAAPAFFPARNKAVGRFPEIDSLADAWAQFKLADVSESDVRDLLANLGGVWRRTMEAWRWGCRVRSASTGAYCWVDWPRPDDSPDYVYPMAVWFTGPIDREFEKEIRERVQRSLRHAKYEESNQFQSEWAPVPETVLSEFRFSEGPEKLGQRRSSLPSLDESRNIQVTISFAGTDPKYGRVGDIPSELGRRLNEWMLTQNLGRVFCYDRPEGDERLPGFMQHLAEGDLVLVFWSQKYWNSPYCMREMQLIYNKHPVGRLLEKRVIVFVFDGQRLTSDTKTTTPNRALRATAWDKQWKELSEQRNAAAEMESGGDLRAKTRILKRDGLQEWYDFIADLEQFEPFIRTMCTYRLAKSLKLPLSDEDCQKAIDDLTPLIQDHLRTPDKMIDLAIQRFENDRLPDAVGLLVHAIVSSPDGRLDVEKRLRNLEDVIPSALLNAAIDHIYRNNMGDT